MNAITVGPPVQACLEPLTDQTELRGADGTLLGYFVPVSDASARMYEQARARFDPEVIRKRAAYQGPWLSTAEVVARLESLESAE